MLYLEELGNIGSDVAPFDYGPIRLMATLFQVSSI